VADSLYLRNDYHDTIMKLIADKLLQKKYRYSDFTFIILKEYLESNGRKLDVLSAENFINRSEQIMMYNPLQRIARERIAPTEIDSYFRHQVIQGYVHDMGAAMEGGLADTQEFFQIVWMLLK
jgi:hypothetical protein